MKAPDNLHSQMAQKTDEQLLSMFNQPDDWLPEALEAARVELRRRGTDLELMTSANTAAETEENPNHLPPEEAGINFRQQAAIWIPIGYILQIFGGVLKLHAKNADIFYGALFMGLVGLGLLIWGCAGYAEG